MIYKCDICGREYFNIEGAEECIKRGLPVNLMDEWRDKYGLSYVRFSDCDETSMSKWYLDNIREMNIISTDNTDGSILSMHQTNFALLSGKYGKETHFLYFQKAIRFGHDYKYLFTYKDNPNSHLSLKKVNRNGELEEMYLPLINGNEAMQKIIDINEKMNGGFML